MHISDWSSDVCSSDLKGEAGERLPHCGPPKIEPRRYGETCVNHDSLWRAGNERAMTRVEFTPDRIIRATKGPQRHEKSTIFGVAGREAHGYSDPPRPDCR